MKNFIDVRMSPRLIVRLDDRYFSTPNKKKFSRVIFKLLKEILPKLWNPKDEEFGMRTEDIPKLPIGMARCHLESLYKNYLEQKFTYNKARQSREKAIEAYRTKNLMGAYLALVEFYPNTFQLIYTELLKDE